MRQNQFLKKVLCYTLVLAMFLQPQIAVAVELSLEEIQRSPTRVFEGGTYYVKRITSEAMGRNLSLQLDPNLNRLQHALILFASSLDQSTEPQTLAVLSPTPEGLVLETMPETPPLVITQGSGSLPALIIRSFNPVTIDAERLENPLVVQSINITLAKLMQVDQALTLQTADFSQVRDPSAPQTPEQQNEAILKGKGVVKTVGLQGNGSLTMISGKFDNEHRLHLKSINLVTNLYNSPTGDLCSDELLSVTGTIYDEGVFRSKQIIQERGTDIRHTRASRSFAGIRHAVTADFYQHNGTVYANYLSQIQATDIELGDSYLFKGERFFAKAESDFSIRHGAHVWALSYIQLENTSSSMVNPANLQIGGYEFKYAPFLEMAYPKGKAPPIDPQAARTLRGEILRAEQKIGPLGSEGVYGILLRSVYGNVYQRGDVSTNGSDIILKGETVNHQGSSHAGKAYGASMHVVAKDAKLEGIIKASKSLLTQIESGLVLGGSIEAPFVQPLSQTLDISGILKAEILRTLDAERVSMLPSSVVEVEHSHLGAKQVVVGGVFTGKTLKIDNGDDKAADSVSFLPSSTVTQGLTQITSQKLSLGGTYEGDSLSHKGDVFTLGGTSAIKAVVAQETDHLRLTGTHTGDLLNAEAGRGIYQDEDANLTLETGAYLSAPEKILAGKIKARLETKGRTLLFGDTSRTTLSELLSRDTESLKFGSGDESRKWDSGEWAHDITHLFTEASFLGFYAPTKLGQTVADVVRAKFSAPVQVKSISLKTKHYTLSDHLTIEEASRIEVSESYNAENGRTTVGDDLEVVLPDDKVLGKFDGAGKVFITSNSFEDPEELLFQGSWPDRGVHMNSGVPVAFEHPQTVNHPVSAPAPTVDIAKSMTLGGGGQFQSTEGKLNLAPGVALTSHPETGKKIVLDAQEDLNGNDTQINAPGIDVISRKGDITLDRAKWHNTSKAEDLNIQAPKGHVSGKVVDIHSEKDINAHAGKDMRLESVVDHYGDSNNYDRILRRAKADAVGFMRLSADGNMVLISLQAQSGDDMNLTAGGVLLDLPLEHGFSRTERGRNYYSHSRMTIVQPSDLRSLRGTVLPRAGDTLEMYATIMRGKKVILFGENGVNLRDYKLVNHHEYTFDGVKHTDFSSYSVGAQIFSEEPIEINSPSGDANLTNVLCDAPRTIIRVPNGVARILLGENYTMSSSSFKKANAFWQSMGYDFEERRWYSPCRFTGILEIHSKETHFQKIIGQTLHFASRIEQHGGISTSSYVEELYRRESVFVQGPTAAAALVVAIAITVCTAGAMSAAGAAVATSAGLTTAATATTAATLTTAEMVVQGLTVAVLQSLALSAANSIMYNTNDFGKAFKDFVKSDTWKGAAKSVAFKGLDMGMGPIFSKVATGMIENKKMGDIVKGIVVDQIAKGLAAQISKAQLDPAVYKAANTVLAAGTGAVLSKNHERGALDAALAANIGMFVGDMATDNPAQMGKNAAERASRENIHPNIALDREATDQMHSSMNIARITTAITAMLAERDVTLCDGVVSNILEHRCTKVLKELASATPEFQGALRAEEARTAQVPSSIPVEPAAPKKMKAKPSAQAPHEKEESAQEKAKKPRAKAKGKQRQVSEQVDPKEAIDSLDQTLQGLDGVQDDLTRASFVASGFNPSETTKTRRHVPDDIDPGYESDTTKRNRIRLRKAEADYEAVKDQGFRARYGKGEELFDARMTYEERIDLRQSLNAADRTSRQTARVVIDGTTGAIRYVRENPLEAAGIAAAVALTAGGAAVSGLVGVAMGVAGGGLGVAGGGLGGLAANHYKVENAQDALNIGASAATGAFAPARGIQALAAGMGVGAGIGAAGYATGSTPMMVDGVLLGAASALGAGRHFVRALASKAPMAGAQNARKFYAFDDSIINTSSNRNMVPPSVGFQFGQVPQRQAATNSNLLPDIIAQRAKATGTHGPAQSFGPRMMAKDDLYTHRGSGGLGHTSSGLPGASAPTRAPATSAPKSAVNPQGEVPKKDVRFADEGGVNSRPLDSSQYSTLFEARLKPETHFPGKSDRIHFQESNKQLYESLQSDPQLKASFESQYPGISDFLKPSPKGLYPSKPPVEFGLTWHHNSHTQGLMELIPRIHHRAPGAVQKNLHPGQKGGMELWGGGRAPQKDTGGI